MNTVSKTFLIIGLCLMTLGATIRLFIHNSPKQTQYKETKSFAIDSVDYHHTLSVGSSRRLSENVSLKKLVKICAFFNNDPWLIQILSLPLYH